jgi:hypothetical protein
MNDSRFRLPIAGLSCIGFLLLALSPLGAQTTTSGIRGTITDASAGAIAAATVTVINLDTVDEDNRKRQNRNLHIPAPAGRTVQPES